MNSKPAQRPPYTVIFERISGKPTKYGMRKYSTYEQALEFWDELEHSDNYIRRELNVSRIILSENDRA